MQLWRNKKMTHSQCISDLVQARDPTSLKLIEIVEGFRAKELEDWILADHVSVWACLPARQNIGRSCFSCRYPCGHSCRFHGLVHITTMS